MNYFIKKAPVLDDWNDGVCKLDEAKGIYDISFSTTAATGLAKEDGCVVVEIPFTVKAGVSGTIAFQIPHGEKGTNGADAKVTKVFGNGGYALATLGTAESSSASSSSSTSSTAVKAGDNGIYAIALIAMVALAGAATVAVKKRSR
jgi:hypothetical protein